MTIGMSADMVHMFLLCSAVHDFGKLEMDQISEGSLHACMHDFVDWTHMPDTALMPGTRSCSWSHAGHEAGTVNIHHMLPVHDAGQGQTAILYVLHVLRAYPAVQEILPLAGCRLRQKS